MPRPLANCTLELVYQVQESIRIQVRIVFSANLTFFSFQNDLERIFLVLALRLHAQDHVSVHLHEPAIGVVGKASITRLGCQAQDSRVIQAKIQDRIHHPRHAHPGSRTNRHQKRIDRIAKLGAHDLFHVPEIFRNLVFQACRIAPVVVIKSRTHISGNCESRWNRNTKATHLCESGALSTE